MNETLYPHLTPAQLALLEAALGEMAIDVPIGRVEPTPTGLRIHLYGGRVLDWPQTEAAAAVEPDRAKPARNRRKQA